MVFFPPNFSGREPKTFGISKVVSIIKLSLVMLMHNLETPPKLGGCQENQSLFRGLDLSVPPPGFPKGEGLEVETITNGQ